MVGKSKLTHYPKADVFASANMAHPKALRDAGKSEPVTSVPNKMQLEALYRAPVATVTDMAGNTAFLPG